MRSLLRLPVLAPLGLLAALTATGLAQRSAAPPAAATAADATARIVKAAQAVLATLDDAGKAKLQFAFDSTQKTNWSNLPIGIYARHSLRMGDLTPPQKAAVLALLQTALSRDGYVKVMDIVRGDEVLRNNGSGGGAPGGAPPAGGPGGAGASRRPAEFRRGRVLPRVRRHAVDDHAVDAAVRWPPPRHQPDDGGQRRDPGAEPAGGAAGEVHRRRQGNPSARPRERQSASR